MARSAMIVVSVALSLAGCDDWTKCAAEVGAAMIDFLRRPLAKIRGRVRWQSRTGGACPRHKPPL
jgi:hypothetical protein